MIADAGLDHLTEVVFVRFLHCDITHSFPLSILYSCVSLTYPHQCFVFRFCLEYFLTFWHYKMPQTHHLRYISYLGPRIRHFSKDP